MKLSAEFQNGLCQLSLIPSDEWEQLLLGSIAKGGERLEATVTYQPEGHYSYGKCKAVKILLQPMHPKYET